MIGSTHNITGSEVGDSFSPAHGSIRSYRGARRHPGVRLATAIVQMLVAGAACWIFLIFVGVL